MPNWKYQRIRKAILEMPKNGAHGVRFNLISFPHNPEE